jgi:hypothetical protein
MEQHTASHLTKRHKIELQILGLAVTVFFFVIVFTPVFIHQWVSQHRMMLMWCEMCLLVMVIIVLWCELYNLRKIIQQTEDTDSTITQQNRYKFYDEKGDLKLVVQPEMLFYLESADNYVIIHYMNSGKMEKIIIKNYNKKYTEKYRMATTRYQRSQMSPLLSCQS